jgi:hypothetical protein
MRTSKQAAIAIVSLTTAVLGMQASASQQAESKKPSNTWRMRCVVKVTTAAEVLPLSFQLVESLLRSDAVAGKAAETVWPRGHGTSDAYFSIRRLGGSDAQESLENDIASPPSVGPLVTGTQTAVFDLHVHLDNDVGPVAREFGNAMIENLRAELQKAFATHRDNLQRQLQDAEGQHKTLRTQFEDMIRQGTFASPQTIQPDPADEALAKQLHRVVDLSAMTQQTPASQAFEILAHSVEPPLNVVVLWRDLLENANVEPSSPIEMDGPSLIQLGAGLQSMLDALADPLAAGKEYRVDYIVAGGAITVATRMGLPQKKLETRVYDLPPLLRTGSQAPELAALIRETIEPDSWHDPYLGSGNGTITPSTDGRLIISQSRDVHIRIQELLTKVTSEVALALPSEAPQETLADRLESLLGYREQLEQELDRLQERQSQLARERNEERRKAAEAALRATREKLYAATDQLKQVQADMAKAKADDPQNAKLQQSIQKLEECMDHCRQIAPGSFTDLGWWIPLSQGTEEKTVAERIAAKQSDLREVSRRIAETQRMQAGSKTFDPEFSRIEWTARRCEQADARIHNLKTRIEDLQPCMVTVIGGIE